LKLLIVFTLIIGSLSARSPFDDKRIIVSKLQDNQYRMRVYFNYENPYETQRKLMGRLTHFRMKLPIQDRLEVTSMYVKVKYTPSLILYHARSSIAVISNEYVIRQFSLNEERYKDIGSATVKADIPVETLKDYNDLGVQIIQHYSSGKGKEDEEDPSAPELWSQIDLKNSFVEFEFRPRFFEEKLSSIKRFMFDNKSIVKESVNFVFPKQPTKDDFYNYSFLASLVGQILKFKDIDFSISTKIINRRNNVLIMNREDAKKLIRENSPYYFGLEEKLSGNINMIRNFNRPDKGILVITGENQEDFRSALYRMVSDDISILEEQNIVVSKTQIPPPAKPYTSPGFVSPGSKVLFSEVGYKTRSFSGEQSDDLYLNFKLYPTVKYRNTDFIESNLNVIYGAILREDSAVNVYLNNNFAYQLKANKGNEEDTVKSSSSQRFEIGKKKGIPTELLRKGLNTLMVQFALVPMHGPQLIRFNNAILKATIHDDSYLIFPLAETEVELPNLKYIAELGFPFSIYPDLQNTGILITDFDSRTIASAMYVSFLLGKIIGYPAYYLTVTADINDVINKDIITIGKQVKRYGILYQNAPIRFTENGVVKEVAVNSKYVDKHGVRYKKFIATTQIVEDIDFQDYLIVQSYQSPFDSKRIVMEFTGQNPQTILNGVRGGLSPKHLNSFNGDTFFYNTETDRSYSYQLKERYILNGLVEE
jgi:hypothetical protein